MIDIADLKEYLNYKGEVPDTFFGKIIDAMTEKMSAYCRRDLRYGVKYDVIDGELQTMFDLERFPIEKIVSIKYRDEWNIPPGGGHIQFSLDLFNGNPTQDNLFLDKRNGSVLLLKGIQLPEGTKNVEVKYLAGYTVNAPDADCETPDDLKSVCLMASAEYFLKSFQGSGRIGISSRTGGAADARITEDFKDEDYSIVLERYRRVR